MMCDRAGEVHAYHDGELDERRARALRAHLEGCAVCRELLEELRGLSGLFRRAEMAGMPQIAMARLEASWSRNSERALLRITSWMTGVAAAVLVGALLAWSSVTAEPAKVTARAKGPAVAAAADPVVLATAAEPPGEANSDLIQVAQWMADDLSIGVNGRGVGGGRR
jgi:anti-sigma factor RsiW